MVRRYHWQPYDHYGLVNRSVFHRPFGYCDVRGILVGASLTNHTPVEHEKRDPNNANSQAVSKYHPIVVVVVVVVVEA